MNGFDQVKTDAHLTENRQNFLRYIRTLNDEGQLSELKNYVDQRYLEGSISSLQLVENTSVVWKEFVTEYEKSILGSRYNKELFLKTDNLMQQSLSLTDSSMKTRKLENNKPIDWFKAIQIMSAAGTFQILQNQLNEVQEQFIDAIELIKELESEEIGDARINLAFIVELDAGLNQIKEINKTLSVYNSI